MSLKRYLMALAFVLAALPAGAYQEIRTPAEKADFQEKGTLYEPMMEYVYDLQSRTDLMSVEKINQTLMGRDIVLCALADPPVRRPSDARKTNKPVVLIVNNVHGGEYAGKDASLMLMRDLALGELRPLLEKAVVLIVPTINPDGAELYRRTNEQNFDLNRDYVKLESQEIRGLVTRVLNEWQPDIHVDTHHGGAEPYTLTFQTCLNPVCDDSITALGNDEIIPRIRQALRRENFDGFWYSGPAAVNGHEGWAPTSCEPRKQHTYSGLSNMVGFLFETPAGRYRVENNGAEVVPIDTKDRYRFQVRGQYIGQREVIRYAAENGDKLRHVLAAAKEKAIQLGSDDTDSDQIVLEYKQESKGDEEFWRAKGWTPDQRRTRGEVEFEKVRLPIFTRFTPTRTTSRPWGYLLPPNLATVVPVLLDHDIAVEKLNRPLEAEVEVYYAAEVSHKEYFQGHYLKAAKVVKRTEKVKFPAGSFFVPSGQPKSNLVSYLLEPETDDNLLTWNYLDNYLEVLTPEQQERRQQMRARFGAREDGRPGQRIPIYRLMKKTALSGTEAEPFNSNRRNRYVR